MSDDSLYPENAFESSSHHDDEMIQLELAMWRHIEHRIKVQARRKIVFKVSSAICVLLLTAAALFWYQYQKVTWVIVTTEAGNMKKIELPDSSVVWLNAGSTLRYPATFHKQRDIQLVEGEAYFDVKHCPSRPFIVHYGNIHTAVLGTAFNIQFYKKLSNIRVTVVRGKVEVGSQKESYGMLIRNQQLEVRPHLQKRVLLNVDAGKVADWKNNLVNLYNVPFDELALRIGNSFNVHVNYSHDQANKLTTIHYSSAYRLEDVLRMIADIHGLNYQINGKEVWLKRK